MSRVVIEIKRLRAGQPRAYADTVYESEITGRNWWDSTTGEREGNWQISEEQARELAYHFVCRYVREPRHALDTQLKTLTKIPRGWRVVIVEPYCD